MSDHPVTSARNLIKQAARAFHYGLDADKALLSVTLVTLNLNFNLKNAARAIGLDSRIGSIAVGKDADLVV